MAPTTLLQLVGRLEPAAWDAIVPHGPVLQERFSHRRADLAALNPQPLPPEEAFAVAAAEMAHRVAVLAIEAEVAGGSSSRFVGEFVDEWCGTPWPRTWPFPGPRPHEGDLVDLELVRIGRVVGAVVLASYGDRLGEGDLRGVLATGAEKLAEVATAG